MFKKVGSKLAKLAPLALLGVTVGSGGIPTLESADISSLSSAVGGQMSWFITNVLSLVPIMLVITFGFLIVNWIMRIMRQRRGRRK